MIMGNILCAPVELVHLHAHFFYMVWGGFSLLHYNGHICRRLITTTKKVLIFSCFHSVQFYFIFLLLLLLFTRSFSASTNIIIFGTTFTRQILIKYSQNEKKKKRKQNNTLNNNKHSDIVMKFRYNLHIPSFNVYFCLSLPDKIGFFWNSWRWKSLFSFLFSIVFFFLHPFIISKAREFFSNWHF